MANQSQDAKERRRFALEQAVKFASAVAEARRGLNSSRPFDDVTVVITAKRFENYLANGTNRDPS